jgi:menaquinone-dependent protoporphyrinogen oxidase
MRVLVAAASRHDATAEIASSIGRALTDAGVQAVVKPARDVDTVGGYNAVVLGSGVYRGRWLSDATRVVERFGAQLRARPVWLFSSGPIGSPDPKPEGEPPEIAEMARSIKARGHRMFGGRLERGRLNLGERVVVAAVRAPDGDFRDWELITGWAREIAGTLLRAVVA